MNVPPEITVNLDAKIFEQCLKTIHDFGSSTYVNICMGTRSVVPWGSVDWGLAFFLMGLGIAIIGLLAAFAILLVRDTS